MFVYFLHYFDHVLSVNMSVSYWWKISPLLYIMFSNGTYFVLSLFFPWLRNIDYFQHILSIYN